MTQPFDDADVVYRFVSTVEERDTYFFDDEYVLTRTLQGRRITYYARRKGTEDEWFFPSVHPILARLLKEREEQEQKEAGLRHAIDDIKAVFFRVEAERDALIIERDALVAERDIYRDAMIVPALEQGRKLRGEPNE